MKKTLALFLTLLIVFLGSWAVKAKTPINRPSDSSDDNTAAWYENAYSAITSEEWYLDPEIPDNYIPVAGEDELYMVVDENGNIIGYRQRTKGADGSWQWKDVDPNIPDNYEATSVKDVYKVTDKDGVVKYYKYIRNDDDTYAFVECNADGSYIKEVDPTDATTIDDNHKKVSKNIYALLNDNDVVIGYRKRVQDTSGNYVWTPTENPNANSDASSFNGSYNTSNVIVNGGSSSNNDGTYDIEDSVTETVTEDGYVITYETIVTKTYDQSGNLLKTKKGDTTVVSKTPISTSSLDKNRVLKTASKEYARVKSKGNFDTDLEKQVSNLLLLYRKENGLTSLKTSKKSTLYYMAHIKAKDMKDFVSDADKSYLYGSMSELNKKYNKGNVIYYNLLKIKIVTAKEINLKLNNIQKYKKNRDLSNVTSYAVAISKDKNFLYICEIFE